MNIFQSVVLGIIEGVTEFLPISSTGHLILTAHLLKLVQTNFLKSFEVAIQLGAILSIVFLYWKTLLLNKEVIKRIIIAFIPTAVIGILFYKIFKEVLLEKSIVLWALFLGGIFIIVFERLYKEKNNSVEEIQNMSFSQAFLIGVFQSIAIIPGVSRAAATIIGGLILGLRRKAIVEFSFLLAVPTMLAATVFDLAKNINDFSFQQLDFLAVGFITSFFVALISVKFLLRFIKKHSFVSFGIYRIILALLFWLIIL